jgi:two-component system sensor histidine kinase PilS (NtrC family)
MNPSDPVTIRGDLAWRIVGLVNIYRLLATGVLLAAHLLTMPTPAFGGVLPQFFVQTCVLYLSVGALLSVAGRRHWPSVRVLVMVHVIVDVLAIAALLYASGGIASNLAVLLVLPVGSMVLLAEHREPLLIAALATLGVLAQQILAQLTGIAPSSDYLQAGVTGVVLFVVALSVWPLSNRLRDNEALVRQHELDLANLAEVSQYIVQHLRESMLVVDPTDRIRLINESAALALGDRAAVPGALLGEVSPPLLYRLSTWRSSLSGAPANESPGPMTSADGTALIEPHFAPLGSGKPPPVLIFLEDTGVLAARVQQTKLAALGRLSASIAHEIRNPVGAMSHAAQLLDEAPQLNAEERRLTEIVRNNARRVSSIVESVLALSRRAAPLQETIDLQGWSQRFCEEFSATMQCAPERLRVECLVPGMTVRVDPGQLQQIVWNLCENALVHGTREGDAGVIEIRFGRMAGNSRPFMEICDRGPGISPEDSERVFEPFFTRGTRGTGLGLFLARELAEINDATLLYAARDGGGSLFRLVFADPLRWQYGVAIGETRRN